MIFSKQRYFDPTALLRAVGDDPEIYLEMCRLFLRTAPDLMRELSLAAADANPDAVRRPAHSLRGACMLVSASPLAQALTEVESAANRGRLPDAAGWIDEVAGMLGCLLQEMREALPPACPDAVAGQGPTERQYLQ